MIAVLDDTLLSDEPRLVAADVTGSLRSAATAGAQVRATWAAARDAGVTDALTGLRPRALVLLATPGTDVVARILSSLLVGGSPVPVVVAESAPPWLGPLDVLVAAHRGRDGDPADAAVSEAVDRAARRGAQVVLTGPSEGPAAAAGAGRALAVTPRLTLGASPADLDGLDTATVLAGGFAVAAALGLLRLDGDALADHLDAEADRDGPRGETFVNPAKTLALRLAERTPLLWGLDPVGAALAAYGATALATHAGVIAQASTLTAAATQPALHARLQAGSSEDAIFADPFDEPGSGGEPPRLVLVTASEAVAVRRMAADAVTRWGADLLEIDDIDIAGDDPVHDAMRATVLAQRLDFTAIYLGLALGAHVASMWTG